MLVENQLRALLLCMALALFASCGKAAPGSDDSRATDKLRIGYQKSGSLALLKWRATLEPELTRRGVQLEWAEFPSGPALLEALNGDQLDFGSVGEAPPIFAQAAASNLVYVAAEPGSPKSEAILVRRESPLTSVAGLVGRSIALNKGSNVHYLLVKALEREGLAYDDVKVVYLPPADARAAFERGTVDAWAIWDPYFASVETSVATRVLANAESLVQNHLFYVGRRAFVDENPDLLKTLLAEIGSADTWISEHRQEAASYLAQELRLDPRAMRLAVDRANFGIRPIGEEVIESQQRIADTFLRLGLIPKPLRIRDALPTSAVNQ